MKIENVIILRDGKAGSVAVDVYAENGVITEIAERGAPDGNTLYATAGFVDEHTHGGYGMDYFAATQEAADAVGKFHLDNGTTSYVATSVATKLGDLDRQISEIRKLKNRFSDMIGLHMEGPFINVGKKGAQPEENIKTVFEDEDEEFFVKNKDMIRIVTLCPHTARSVQLVKCLKSCGIIANAGHDGSIYPEIEACVEAGLDAATHVYCASSGLGRRKGDLTKYIGLNETALLDSRIMTEVIADDMHISEPLFRFIYKNKGYRKIMLVSDSLSAAGMPVGTYKLGRDIDVYNNGKVALLADFSALAGSITPVSKMVEIVASYGVPVAEAVYMGNQAPCAHLGLTDRDVIAVGKRADICLLDGAARLQAVYQQGRRIV